VIWAVVQLVLQCLLYLVAADSLQSVYQQLQLQS